MIVAVSESAWRISIGIGELENRQLIPYQLSPLADWHAADSSVLPFLADFGMYTYKNLLVFPSNYPHVCFLAGLILPPRKFFNFFMWPGTDIWSTRGQLIIKTGTLELTGEKSAPGRNHHPWMPICRLADWPLVKPICFVSSLADSPWPIIFPALFFNHANAQALAHLQSRSSLVCAC